MKTPATRLITLIMLLQRQPNQKAADLAEQLGVSVRTLHRYFEMLDEIGIPIYAERGPHGGFSLVRGYKLPPLVFTPEEAVAISLGTNLVREMWGQLYQEAALGALAKLDNVLPDAQRAEVAWAQRALIATGMHRADSHQMAPFLDMIRTGARQHRQIEIRYHSGSQPGTTERHVDPYALVHRIGWWYLIGHCHLRQALRTFRVDRIIDLELLEQEFEYPDDFDPYAYLEAEFQNQPVVRAHLRFAPEAAHIVQANHFSWEAVQKNADGSLDVTMAAPDLYWIASLVLSFATWVTVLDPPELRTMVHEWAAATAAIYHDPPSERKE
ncbi:MAG: YafY family transcriptional regulator [Anaerolineales bacterium]|nr:YafY family transcriptional regulator [Anaerolineales bacterium]